MTTRQEPTQSESPALLKASAVPKANRVGEAPPPRQLASQSQAVASEETPSAQALAATVTGGDPLDATTPQPQPEKKPASGSIESFYKSDDWYEYFIYPREGWTNEEMPGDR
jgi:hypothetical protein